MKKTFVKEVQEGLKRTGTIGQEIITENHALMMYQPFLGDRQQE